MKTNYLIGLVLLLFACQSPEKLHQKGETEAAFTKLMFKGKNKLSESEKVLLAQIHTEKMAGEILLIEEWSELDDPEIWPRIKGRLDRIAIEQHAVLQRGREQNISNIKPFPNLKEKLAEASIRSADYYYNRQQEEYVLAKRGSKKAARRGYDLGEKAMEYELDYKTVQETNMELKEIGTDYIVVYVEVNKEFLATQYCMEEFQRTWATPQLQEWSVVSFKESDMPRVDFWLRVSPDQAFVGQPQWSSASCTSSVEVQVGTKEVEEWSETDSAYVKKQVPLYQEVYVTVTNYQQYLRSNLPISVELFRNGKNESINKVVFEANYNWSNAWGESDGDTRAITGACCPTSGIDLPFPSEESMLRYLGSNARAGVQKFLDDSIETYSMHNARKRRSKLFNW